MSIIIISFLVIIIEKGIFPSFFPSGFIPQFLLIYLISLTNWQIRNFHTELKWHNIALAIFISGMKPCFIDIGNICYHSFRINLAIAS